MKIPVFILSISLYFSSCSFTPRAEWVTTTENSPWAEQPDLISALADTIPNIDITILTEKHQQQIDGFGACFNELGWLSLSKLGQVYVRKSWKSFSSPESEPTSRFAGCL